MRDIDGRMLKLAANFHEVIILQQGRLEPLLGMPLDDAEVLAQRILAAVKRQRDKATASKSQQA